MKIIVLNVSVKCSKPALSLVSCCAYSRKLL